MNFPTSHHDGATMVLYGPPFRLLTGGEPGLQDKRQPGTRDKGTRGKGQGDKGHIDIYIYIYLERERENFHHTFGNIYIDLLIR